jgi:hypothetical protein
MVQQPADPVELIGAQRALGRVLAAVVRDRLDLGRVVRVERLERDDRDVHQHRAAQADDDDADGVDPIWISLGSRHGGS